MSQPSPDLATPPGAPGLAPTWTSSAKDIVGCTIGASRLWFTLGFGIINEVYYPRADIPQIRDLGFIVADDKGFWVEIKRLESYKLDLLAPGVPAVKVVHRHERFTLTLRVTPDPDRDVLAIELKLDGDPDLSAYVLLAPHLGASGYGNVAKVEWVGGRRVLGAEQGPFALALSVVDEKQGDGLLAASAGYVGFSDGWHDFHENGRFDWRFSDAGPGNVALTGAVPRHCVLTLGFGFSIGAAGVLAISSALQPFDGLVARHSEQWTRWHADRSARSVIQPDFATPLGGQFQLSSMVLRSHRDKTYPGTMVASLSVPWGNSHDDRGGYHLVWPRDLVETATALLALGAEADARNTLRYLMATQKADGSWSQNQWLGGAPYWNGVQLDETAFPVLLAAALAERQALGGIEVGPMVAGALGHIARTGPSSEQDRWEENAGINAFTMAIALAALVAGADFLPPPARRFVLQLADAWNSRLEEWMVVEDTPLAREHGVPGYYVRIAPPETPQDRKALEGVVQVKNRDGSLTPIASVVGGDFLQLVRFGLRAPDDPWIVHTLKVTDALLKVDTPSGPAWRRYNGDGYGEHADGAPFDGWGIGRAWPLLTGERGHYELAAGRDPLPYLTAMDSMTGPGGMLPEQVWDAAPLPDRKLYLGRPSGSAMPLVWAHAEFIKLMTSREIGYPFDRPEAVWRRWGGHKPAPTTAVWTPNAPVQTLARGSDLVFATPHPARLHWGHDGWKDPADLQSTDIGIGVHVIEFSAASLAAFALLDFTFFWLETGQWHGANWQVRIGEAA